MAKRIAAIWGLILCTAIGPIQTAVAQQPRALAEAADGDIAAGADPAPAAQPAPPRAPVIRSPMAPAAPQPLPGQAATPSPAPSNPPPGANEVTMETTAANDAAFDSSGALYDLASVPDMIGDAPGIKYLVGRADVPLAGGDRGIKIAEDSRPLPTDRVFFDFNYFGNALSTADGRQISMERYTFGIEKTFFGGHASVELRAPVDTGLSQHQDPFQGAGSNEGTVFGDLTITPKVLLCETPDLAVAIGVTVGLPTAPQAEALVDVGTPVDVQFKSQAVHVAPFIGVQYAPNDRFFATGFFQVDVDCNGDEVLQQFITEDPRLRSPTLAYGDVATGYWLFRDRACGEAGPGRYLTGLAPVLEFHYTGALQDAHAVGVVTPLRQRPSICDVTAGAHLQLGRCSMLTLAGCFPLTQTNNKLFDSEFVLQFNRRF